MDIHFDDLQEDFQLSKTDPEHEEELLNHITDRVEHYLRTDKGLLLSYMYRLDIEEKHIQKALQEQGDEPISLTLAKLILNRQKQRVNTKLKYGNMPPIEGWEY
jgi:hypothetical protein